MLVETYVCAHTTVDTPSITFNSYTTLKRHAYSCCILNCSAVIFKCSSDCWATQVEEWYFSYLVSCVDSDCWWNQEPHHSLTNYKWIPHYIRNALLLSTHSCHCRRMFSFTHWISFFGSWVNLKPNLLCITFEEFFRRIFSPSSDLIQCVFSEHLDFNSDLSLTPPHPK
jgi:hypothetical protein